MQNLQVVQVWLLYLFDYFYIFAAKLRNYKYIT